MATTPIPAFKFSFQLTLEGVSDTSDPEYFYAIDGLGLMYQMDRYFPGGYGKSYSIPLLYETDNLTLKRPVVQDKTNITKWCEQALDTSIFKPTIAHIFVFNKDKSINTHWSVEQVYPIGLKISSLDLESGSPVVIETITLAYTRLNRVA
jgi:phage tail-like protein